MTYINEVDEYLPEPKPRHPADIWEHVVVPRSDIVTRTKLVYYFQEHHTPQAVSREGNIYMDAANGLGAMTFKQTREGFDIWCSSHGTCFLPVFWQNSQKQLLHGQQFLFENIVDDKLIAALSDLAANHGKGAGLYETISGDSEAVAWSKSVTNSPLVSTETLDAVGCYKFGNTETMYYIATGQGHLIFDTAARKMALVMATRTVIATQRALQELVANPTVDPFLEVLRSLYESKELPVSQANYKDTLSMFPKFAPEVRWWDVVYAHLGYDHQ